MTAIIITLTALMIFEFFFGENSSSGSTKEKESC